MNEIKVGRRERRRKKVEMKMEGNQQMKIEIQKTIENLELSSKSIKSQSLGKLVRRDTYIVLHPKTDIGEDVNANSESSSAESRNFTYSLNGESISSNQRTFNVDKPADPNKVLPVPAPRKNKTKSLEIEKVSSDTDRDVTEIDLDDMRIKYPDSDISFKPSPTSSKTENKFEELKHELATPIPKPRKNLQKLHKEEFDSRNSINDTVKSHSPSLNSKSEEFREKVNESGDYEPSLEKQQESNEVPLVTELQEEAKPESVKHKSKKHKRLTELLDRKGRNKKSKTFSTLMKLEKKNIPKISSILKDLKEEEKKPEVEDNKLEFQIDSPHFKESVQNGRIYVQGKNRFHVMERDEVLKKEKKNTETDGNGGIMEESTVKTAVLFQSFWSRCMTYFHGVLAGIGFSHAATITTLMLHNNYEPQGFIADYSCLSLKIHYVFYTLIALCIISCFDRIDVGHMNRRHWEKVWKLPCSWLVLLIYIIGFALTFANQKTEARIDAHLYGNETEVWNGQSHNEIQASLLQWYHTVWARDGLVLFAWLVIALTKFEDFLHSHINNMAKYAHVNAERGHRHKGDYF